MTAPTTATRTTSVSDRHPLRAAVSSAGRSAQDALIASHHVPDEVDLLAACAPGAASTRWVIAPSRITRTVWLRPIVSSSVSEVRITRDALGRHGADQLVDLLLGADVEAARRMVEDQDARACAFSHLASTTFCWLPPERLRQSVSMPGVRMRSRSTQSLASRRSAARVDQAEAA